MFLPIPYNHTVFLFHTILQLSSQCISSTGFFFFHLWSRKLFSPFLLPPTICSFYFLRTGKAVASPGWWTSSFSLCQFWGLFGCFKSLFVFFFPSPLQVDGEEEGRFLLKQFHLCSSAFVTWRMREQKEPSGNGKGFRLNEEVTKSKSL